MLDLYVLLGVILGGLLFAIILLLWFLWYMHHPVTIDGLSFMIFASTSGHLVGIYETWEDALVDLIINGIDTDVALAELRRGVQIPEVTHKLRTPFWGDFTIQDRHLKLRCFDFERCERNVMIWVMSGTLQTQDRYVRRLIHMIA